MLVADLSWAIGRIIRLVANCQEYTACARLQHHPPISRSSRPRKRYRRDVFRPNYRHLLVADLPWVTRITITSVAGQQDHTACASLYKRPQILQHLNVDGTEFQKIAQTSFGFFWSVSKFVAGIHLLFAELF